MAACCGAFRTGKIVMLLLDVSGLVKRFGGLLATDNLDLTVAPGEVHALIGPNGAGKTTLINQLMGEIQPDQGTILFDGVEINELSGPERARRGLATLFSDFSGLSRSVRSGEHVDRALPHDGEQCRVWFRALDDTELGDLALKTLRQVGLEGKEDANVTTLAHGEVRQLELAMALVTEAKAAVVGRANGRHEHE